MGLIPCLIRTDNGKIETSNLMIQMAGDVPFALEHAPAGDAHAKPVVESTFDLLNDLFNHQIAITMKGSPEARGVHDPDEVARKHGVDAAMFEKAFMQVLYGVYVHRHHGGLRERPAAVLKERLAQFPCRTWQGTADELRRLLRRDEGSRITTRQGISYKGYMYGAKWCRKYGVNRPVRIKVDEDDIRSIDVYDADGVFLGSVTCTRIAERYGRAVSRWELDLEDEADKAFAAAAERATRPELDRIKKDLMSSGKAARTEARKRLQQERAAETAVSADVIEIALAPVDRPAATVPPTLPLPVRTDRQYRALVDPEAA